MAAELVYSFVSYFLQFFDLPEGFQHRYQVFSCSQTLHEADAVVGSSSDVTTQLELYA